MAYSIEWSRSHRDSANRNWFDDFLFLSRFICYFAYIDILIIIILGKTLAFLLPALIHIDGQVTPREERPGPNVLVMAPTRELALQIEKEVGKYSYRGIKA